MYIILCNDLGEKLPGTDGIIWLTRKNPKNAPKLASECREGFRINFPHKFEFWTHYYIQKDLRTDYRNEKLFTVE